MRSSVASIAMAAAWLLTPAVAGLTPASSQDFSITNTAPPASGSQRDVMRQLLAWWTTHAYYPRHASNSDEGGTVKLHVEVLPDGRLWQPKVAESSGSSALDSAATATFTGGFVRPMPTGAAGFDIDLVLHYVLAHRHDQPVPTDYVSVPSKQPFTIANDPVSSPVLTTMLQKTCTGEVVKQGIRNHPWYGQRIWAQAVFFRRSDGTPWVKFYEDGFSVLSPVSEVGKTVQWTGRQEHLNGGVSWFTQYTMWPDGENKISGNLEAVFLASYGAHTDGMNHGGTVDLTCAAETVPAISWSSWSAQTLVGPSGDPP